MNSDDLFDEDGLLVCIVKRRSERILEAEFTDNLRARTHHRQPGTALLGPAHSVPKMDKTTILMNGLHQPVVIMYEYKVSSH